MQAPTAPSGSPAEAPEERPCPGCGASNGRLAAFCWQCYRQFGATAPGPTGRGPATAVGRPGTPYAPVYEGLRGAVSTPMPVPFPEQRAGRGLVGAARVAAVALAAAGVFFFLNRGPGVELPSSFGGLSEVRNPQVEAILETFDAQADDGGFEAAMGLYGEAGTPIAGLAWVVDATVPTSEEAFAIFAGGFNTGLGTGTLDQGRTTTEAVDGVEYVCAPVVSTPPANLCMWQVDEVFWILFDFSGTQMDATRDLAVGAHDATSA